MISHKMVRIALAVSLISLLSVTTFAAGKSAIGSPLLVSTDALAAPHQSWVVLQISRDRMSYDRGHIPGARLVLLSQIVTAHDGNDNELPTVEQLKTVFESAGISNGSRVVLYDDAQGLFAARALFTLDYLGLGSRAALLDGGLAKWIAEGRPLDRNIPQITPGHIKALPHPEIVVQFAQMRDFSAKATKPSSGVVLIDARSPQQYGYVSGNVRGGAGHIPGAHNVFWMDMLQNPTLSFLKTPELIRSIYKNAGVRPGVKVIVYCNSGMQAAHAYITLRMIGMKPTLYDGSFQEWARHPEAPIE